MCLITTTNKPKYAEREIRCFKVVQESKLDDHPFMTPYENSLIHQKVADGEWDFVAFGPKKIEESNSLNTSYIISAGFIHTFKFYRQAEWVCNWCEAHYEGEYHLYECVIPAGTEYFEGTDNNGFDTFASDRIRFVNLEY